MGAKTAIVDHTDASVYDFDKCTKLACVPKFWTDLDIEMIVNNRSKDEDSTPSPDWWHIRSDVNAVTKGYIQRKPCDKNPDHVHVMLEQLPSVIVKCKICGKKFHRLLDQGLFMNFWEERAVACMNHKGVNN